MSTVTSRFITLGAVHLLDRTVSVQVDGHSIDGFTAVPRDELLEMLRRYVKAKGPLLVSTKLLDGSTTKDVVHPDGRTAPYIPEAQVLFAAIDRRSYGAPVQEPSLWDATPPPATPYRPEPHGTSTLDVVGPVPEWDVEADMRRKPRPAPASRQARRPQGGGVGGAVFLGVVLVITAVAFLLLPRVLG
ncbi:hypothetical protein [Sinomonas sp. RB5]